LPVAIKLICCGIILPIAVECRKKAISLPEGINLEGITKGAFWFMGWLFTIAFANLVWWKIIVGIVVWPYFLGLAVR
jgi:hypothetical protein